MSNSAQLWFPYAQMKGLHEIFHVSDAEGVYLKLADGRELIDATSSWWCMIHGYKHPKLNAAMQQQIEQFSHVMLGGLTHDTAIQLTEKLVEITPAGLNHVFYSDSGSVAVEIALKQAVQYWQNLGQTGRSKILAFKKAYHGDTSGCMSVCDPDDMHRIFKGLIPQHYFAEAPASGQNPTAQDVEQDLDSVRQILQQHHEQIAAVIIEPLLQAAGGFNMYSPAYLNSLKALCDDYDVLLIFDEVATGFGRTGSVFATDQSSIVPDILILGKALTGGYIGHAATLSNDRVFDAFYVDDKAKAFMHGPTFMGNPLSCATALASIDVFFEAQYPEKIGRINAWLKQAFGQIESGLVRDIRIQGATAVVEVFDKSKLAEMRYFAADRGVWLRPYEQFVYTMPPYIITQAQIQQIADVIQQWFDIQ